MRQSHDKLVYIHFKIANKFSHHKHLCVSVCVSVDVYVRTCVKLKYITIKTDILTNECKHKNTLYKSINYSP